MQMLNDSWLTSEPIDFEYKKYLLLAYNKKLTEDCKQRKLYPHLSDIVDRLMYVNDFLKAITAFEESAKEIDKINWIRKEIRYKTRINDDTFDDIKYLAWYSQNVLSDLYQRFKNLYDDIDGSIVISGTQYPIFDKYCGYLRIKFDYGRKEKILNYEIYKILYPEPSYVLKTSKADMKEYYSDRYLRNIYDVIVNEDFPAKESSIPVIRRKFLLHVVGGYQF